MYSPLEQFKINQLIPLDLGIIDLSITNSGLIILFGLFILWQNIKWVLSKPKIVPTKWQWGWERLTSEIKSIVQENIGVSGRKFFPFVYTIFVFILIMNFLGMVPYVFSVTSHIVVTFVMSLSVWLGVTMIGFRGYGLSFFAMFMPQGVPIALGPFIILIEVLSYIARAISLGLRLAANVTSGHILLHILSGFGWTLLIGGGLFSILGILAILIIIFLTGLELAVAFVQAYVFTLLTAIYLNDGVHLH